MELDRLRVVQPADDLETREAECSDVLRAAREPSEQHPANGAPLEGAPLPDRPVEARSHA